MAATRPRAPDGMATGTFRSLKIFTYRVWAVGLLVANVGTWMQRTAQNWLAGLVGSDGTHPSQHNRRRHRP